MATNGLGWIKDLPDPRDLLYRVETDLFYDLSRFNWRGALWWKKPNYPASVDLVNGLPRKGVFPAIYNQGQLGSCSAQSVARMLAYIESVESPGNAIPLSRLYMYYYARLGIPYDTGASLRVLLAGIQLEGVSSETLWPYDISKFTETPPTLAKEDGSKRKKIKYAKLTSLDDMQNCLANGYPFVFGAMIFDAFMNPSVDAGGRHWIPMPSKTDQVDGGHCLCAVGYDSTIVSPDGHKGAIRIANSWDTSWGDQGYAWIPFDYVCSAITSDFWTVRYIPV